MQIVGAGKEHLQPWAEMRFALWTWDTVADHADEAENSI